MRENQQYNEAKKRVKKKKGFYRHLMAYLAVNTALATVVLITEGTLEGLIPGIFWGIGLSIHYLSVFGFPGKNRLGGTDWEQREIERELHRMNAFDDPDINNEDSLDLEEELELKKVERIKKRYDDSDLV